MTLPSFLFNDIPVQPASPDEVLPREETGEQQSREEHLAGPGDHDSQQS